MSVNALPLVNFFNNTAMPGANVRTQLPFVNFFNNNSIAGGYSNVYAQQMNQMQNMFQMQNMMQYQQMMREQQQMLNMLAFNGGRAHADNLFQNAAFLAQMQTPGMFGMQQPMGCHVDYLGMLGGFNPMTMMGGCQQPMMPPMMGGYAQPMMQQPMMVPVQTMQMMPVMTAGGYGAGGGFNAGLGGLFNGLSGLLNGTIGLAGQVLKLPFQLVGGILSGFGGAGQTAKA